MSRLKDTLSGFSTFGDLLKFLRRRAQLSQRELSIAVGYSESQISRLETNQRSPDSISILALFVPALGIEDEPELIERLVELSKVSHTNPNQWTTGENSPAPKLNPASIAPILGNQTPPLPTGMFTFLFSDVEGSTPLWEKQPEPLRNHMPVQLTSFIGREEELTELCNLLRSNEHRLVVLTGEGGCGKTRLALRVGEDLAQDFERGA